MTFEKLYLLITKALQKQSVFNIKSPCQDFSTIATVGAQPTKAVNFTFLEVGGQLLPLWQTYAADAKGIL